MFNTNCPAAVLIQMIMMLMSCDYKIDDVYDKNMKMTIIIISMMMLMVVMVRGLVTVRMIMMMTRNW